MDYRCLCSGKYQESLQSPVYFRILRLMLPSFANLNDSDGWKACTSSMPQVRFSPGMWRWVLFAMAAAPSPGGKPESGRPPASSTFPHPLSPFLLRFKQKNASKRIFTIYCGIWWINRTLELINQEKVAQPLKRQTILRRGNSALSTSVSGWVSNQTYIFMGKCLLKGVRNFKS